MINKQYILKDLVLSLFVCLLLAGTAGCSNEGMLPEGGEELDNGGTTSFSIVMGRVVTGVPTDGNFDDYISSVRVLAFKDATLKYNMLFTASGGNDGKVWTIVDDGISIADENVPLEGGTYTFYFIANEGEHQLNDTGNLKDKLAGSLTEDELLMQLIISYSEPSEDTPILMTARKEWHIIAGSKNETDVELTRALAKLDYVQVKNADGASMEGTFSLSIQRADKYYLFPSSGNLVPDYNTIQVTNKPLKNSDANLIGIYFSEGSKVELSTLVALIENGTSYWAPADANEIVGERNKGVQINATITDTQQCLQVNTSITPWEIVELPPTYE